MEIEFNEYKEIDCRTKDRVIECMGYGTNLCEGICNYARVYDKFHSAKSGIQRFHSKLEKTLKLNPETIYPKIVLAYQKQYEDEPLFIGGTG